MSLNVRILAAIIGIGCVIVISILVNNHLIIANNELTELILFQNEMFMYSLEKLNITLEEFNEDFLQYKLENLLDGNRT